MCVDSFFFNSPCKYRKQPYRFLPEAIYCVAKLHLRFSERGRQVSTWSTVPLLPVLLSKFKFVGRSCWSVRIELSKQLHYTLQTSCTTYRAITVLPHTLLTCILNLQRSASAMVKLNYDVLVQASSYLNALKDRELDLRGTYPIEILCVWWERLLWDDLVNRRTCGFG